MAIIKKSEFNQMNDRQLTEKLGELQKELMKLRSQIATHTTLESPGRVRSVRKMIARIYTRINQKKLAAANTQQKPVEQKEKKDQKKSESQIKKKTKEVVKIKK